MAQINILPVTLPAETLVPVPTSVLPLDSLLPEESLLMMGAGPVPIPSRVAAANSIVINHLGDTMAQIIEQVKSMSRYVFQSSTARILGVAGPGSAAMEMAIVNMVESGDTVVSICTGFFSNRLAEMAERVGATVVRLEVDNTKAVMVESVRDYFIRYQPRILTIVQGETSNTVFIDKAHRLNSVVGINIAERVDGQQLLHMMSSVYRVEISGSFGANIARIGQMGEQARSHNIFRALHALGASVQALDESVDVPAGVSALERSIERFKELEEVGSITPSKTWEYA